MDNQRIFERFPIARIAFAEGTEIGKTCCGVLKNISAGGAMIDLTVPFSHLGHMFEMDMAVDVTIDEFQPLRGKVARVMGKAIGIVFKIDEGEQSELMNKILVTMEKEGATAL